MTDNEGSAEESTVASTTESAERSVEEQAEDFAGGQSDDAASIRIEIVPDDKMPCGIYAFPVDRPGMLTWYVREGHMSETLRDEMNHILQQLVSVGQWRQHWGGPAEGPPASRS